MGARERQCPGNRRAAQHQRAMRPTRSLLVILLLHLEDLKRTQQLLAERTRRQAACTSKRRAFFTIFCSSTRKARTMRSRTAPPLSTPPYARCTVFLLCDRRLLLYCAGRRRGTCVGRRAAGVRQAQGACALDLAVGLEIRVAGLLTPAAAAAARRSGHARRGCGPGRLPASEAPSPSWGCTATPACHQGCVACALCWTGCSTSAWHVRASARALAQEERQGGAPAAEGDARSHGGSYALLLTPSSGSPPSDCGALGRRRPSKRCDVRFL